MKNMVLLTAVCAALIAGSFNKVQAGVQLKASNKHVNLGIGLVTSKIPVSDAGLKILITTVNYDYCFMDPMKKVRTSVELGLYGFYGILPLPEVGANLYIGSEDQDIHYKFGVGCFYDLFIGGHAGLVLKPGIIFMNRFDFSFYIVPTGTDSNKSYRQALNMETEDEAEDKKKENGSYVTMPYYGLMFTVRL